MKAVAEHLFMPPNVESRCYDPFVGEFAVEPEAADLVICTDVLEHVEQECTGAVLDHIQSLTKRLVFFSISLVKAEKILADGRNAHINLPGAEFWLKEIRRRFITSEAKLINGTESLLVVAQSIEDVREYMRTNVVS
jgi:2-polyprenyl-3-methyl-5-hydroxy-6-metoxy-1,4-benzoquinol methylase